MLSDLCFFKIVPIPGYSFFIVILLFDIPMHNKYLEFCVIIVTFVV